MPEQPISQARDCAHGQLARSCDICADRRDIDQKAAALALAYRYIVDSKPRSDKEMQGKLKVLEAITAAL